MKNEFGRTYGALALRRFFRAFVLGTIILLFPARNLSAGTKISTHYLHVLTLQTDGTVWAWGVNNYGQLGDGTNINRNSPIRVSGLDGVISISAGEFHSLALKADGSAWAWGYGVVGDGTWYHRNYPVRVLNLDNVVDLCAGAYHSLALKADGTVWAWGINYDGQLGDGTVTSRSSPVKVSSLSQIVAIEAGYFHSLALKSDGTVWAWGSNLAGELGNGTSTGSSTPVQVSSLTNAVSISAGYLFSTALKDDGTAWAWGSNYNGQLGDGSTLYKTIPVQVKDLYGVISISAGYKHCLAQRTDGTVWAWGSAEIGALGDGTYITYRVVPCIVPGFKETKDIIAGFMFSIALRADGTVWAWGGPNSPGIYGNGAGDWFSFVPRQLQFSFDPKGYSMISGGQQHSFALKPGAIGTVRAWGSNSLGQLGNGTTVDSHSPILVTGLKNVKSIASDGGAFHSVALRPDGLIWAWGLNLYGQLGDGTNANSLAPKQVIAINSVRSVAEGYLHTLALVDGAVQSWGWNQHGQLGTDNTIDYAFPVSVSGLNKVKSISGGSRHSLALKSDGTVWAWGWNEYGQLGDNSVLDKSSPVQVAGLSDAAAVSGGVWFSLALEADGTIWAWGSNASGQLGNGTGADSLIPVRASGLDKVKAVAAGADHSLALKADGTVWTWGHNGYGQLGDGTLVTRFSPVRVSDLTDVMAIACGVENSFAIKADGTIWAWGYNNSGQLGDGTTVSRTRPVQILNDNCSVSVAMGSYVTVTPTDPATGNTPVTLEFENVSSAGTVSVNSYNSSAIPVNFRLASPLKSYSVTTTAEYNGNIDICIHYEELVGIDESGLRLLHYWDANVAAGKLPGVDPNFDYAQSGWEDVTKTGSPDTLNNVICGTVTCLSPFIIGMPISITGPTAPVRVNNQISLSAPHNGEASAEWDFGDATVEPSVLSGDTWTGAHMYSAAGAYVIRLTLFDANGTLIGQAEYRTAIYDPSGAFITGGGWIDSPAGACLARPDTTGKANFSFEAKYQKDASVPSGNLEFQFKEGDLNFKAKVIDWLAVAGAKARFEGAGTINGKGSYRFMAVAIDGEIEGGGGLDKFRIRIWDAAGGGLIYDNEVGKDENGDPTTVIGGGSLVIHEE